MNLKLYNDSEDNLSERRDRGKKALATRTGRPAPTYVSRYEKNGVGCDCERPIMVRQTSFGEDEVVENPRCLKCGREA